MTTAPLQPMQSGPEISAIRTAPDGAGQCRNNGYRLAPP